MTVVRIRDYSALTSSWLLRCDPVETVLCKFCGFRCIILRSSVTFEGVHHRRSNQWILFCLPAISRSMQKSYSSSRKNYLYFWFVQIDREQGNRPAVCFALPALWIDRMQ